jgi:hypothetical protein
MFSTNQIVRFGGSTSSGKLNIGADSSFNCLRLKNNSSVSNYTDIDLDSTGVQVKCSVNGASPLCNIVNHNLSTTGLALGGVLLLTSASDLNKLDATPGTASASKALVMDTSLNISGINNISCNILNVNNNIILTSNDNTSSYVTSITPGTAAASKTLVVDSSKNITGINSLSLNSSLVINNTTISNGTSSTNSSITRTISQFKKYSGFPSNIYVNCIEWSPELGIFVAVGLCWDNSIQAIYTIMTSIDGINWEAQVAPNNNALYSVAWSPSLGLFAAVSSNGTGNRVSTSPDGKIWTSRTSAANVTWVSICWAASISLFVAVAADGTTSNNVMTSPNGITWTSRTSTNTGWYSIAWAPSIPLLVAVGQTGTGNRVMTSPDGVNWTSRTSAADNPWTSVCWSSSLSLFVAVASTGSTSNIIMTSSNGTSWTSRTSPNTNNWRSVTWASGLSLFVAVSSSGSANRVMTSPDGTTWTSRTTTGVDVEYYSISYSPSLNTLAAGGTGTGNYTVNKMSYSTNATSWTLLPTSYDLGLYSDIIWEDSLDLFIPVCFSGNKQIMTSPDGKIWTLQTTPVPYTNLYAVTYAPSLSLLVCVGTNTVLTSPDAITWTSRTPANSNAWSGLAWSPSLSLFVAVSTSGAGSRLMTSPNGITWTGIAVPVHIWYDVTWSIELSLFIAVNYTNYGSQIMTSPDGSNWTMRTTQGSHNPQRIVWVKELSLLFAYGSNSYITSPDGINWTSRTFICENTTTFNGVYSIRWHPVLNRLVTGAIHTSLNDWRLFMSSDGITWISYPSPIFNRYGAMAYSSKIKTTILYGYSTGSTSYQPFLVLDQNLVDNTSSNNYNISDINRIANPINIPTTTAVSTWNLSSASANVTYNSVCWSPELLLFVAVASGGTSNGVSTSPNGITWTTRVPPSNSAWNSVCWSPELLLFVAVSSTGATTDIMTSSNGTTWTARTAPTSNGYYGVSYSPELQLFIAVSAAGTGNRVITSGTGTTWLTCPSAADNTWTSTCWSGYLGLFVAVASSGSGNRVMTSPDAITWTSRTSAADNTWTSVCWSPELNLLVAVANSGSGNRVMTSSDGLTWTSRTSASDNAWDSVVWSPELMIFTAVANTGDSSDIMTSPDGVTWTTRTSPGSAGANGICWSPQLNVFLTIGSGGTNNVFMSTAVLPARNSVVLANPNTLFLNNVNGRVGLGTNTPATQLQLSTDLAAKPSTSTWTVSSDSRLKENIQDADLDLCYTNVKNLRLARYKWKDEVYTEEEVSDRSKLGWIAQEVEVFLPKAVEQVNAHGLEDCRTLNTDQIIASLYGAVKKLQNRYDSQTTEITELNNKINILDNIIASVIE